MEIGSVTPSKLNNQRNEDQINGSTKGLRQCDFQNSSILVYRNTLAIKYLYKNRLRLGNMHIKLANLIVSYMIDNMCAL